MKVKFVVLAEDGGHSIDNDGFPHDVPLVPRVGENVVRHVEEESSLDNRFIVSSVHHVLETREWYLNQSDMINPVVVYLEREKKDEDLKPIEWYGEEYEVVCGLCEAVLDVSYNAEWESWMVEKCSECFE